MKAAVAALALLAVAGDLAAAPQPRPATPCNDCLLAIPDHPVGLLVVLHGDDAGASSAFADWRDAARHANLAVLAPQCPANHGCNGSWWRWAVSDHHDPAWLDAQIASAVTAAHTDRIYVAGFSGGASYLASWAPAHADTISRVAFVAGGYPASDRCPTHPLSALFLIGGDDPMLDPYVRPLVAWLGTCANVELTWRIVPGLGHAAMHAALRRGRAAELIAWFVDSPTKAPDPTPASQ